MGFKYAVLFPRARDALFQYAQHTPYRELPSNICPVAAEAIRYPKLFPVHPETGLAHGITVQLYGYRETNVFLGDLDLDPLMTGWFDKPCATSAIISLGRKKILPLSGGGVFLTQDEGLALEMRRHEYFPGGKDYRRLVGRWLKNIDLVVEPRFERIALWDRYLGDILERIPREQVMPWRVMRRVPHGRDTVVKALREVGVAVGTNYPPLPGVTAPGAIQWGNEVINFLIDEPLTEVYIAAACEIIKRVVNG